MAMAQMNFLVAIEDMCRLLDYDFFKKNFLVKKGACFFKNTFNAASHNKKSLSIIIYTGLHRWLQNQIWKFIFLPVLIFLKIMSNILSIRGLIIYCAIKNDFDKIANSNLSGLKKIMNLDFDTNLIQRSSCKNGYCNYG